MEAIKYILDELLKDNLDYVEMYAGINEDGEREKIKLKNIKCYIQDEQKIKYTSDKRTITINGYIYLKGDPFPNIRIFDGKISVNNQEFKIIGGRKYRDIFSEDIVYTRLEVI